MNENQIISMESETVQNPVKHHSGQQDPQTTELERKTEKLVFEGRDPC